MTYSHTTKSDKNRVLFRSIVMLGLLMVLLLSGCQAVAETGAQPASTAEPERQGVVQVADEQEKESSQDYSATLEFTPFHAEVGATVAVGGTGYPADATIELVWYTMEGQYELEGGTEFIGQRYDERSEVVATVRADETGAIEAELEVPLDYGGPHDVRGRVDGKELSQAGLTIDPTFSMTPEEGPVGTPIELQIVGVDWRDVINTWHVLYDNDYMGFMSAVTTKGVATARFRAAGPVGRHEISVWHNSFNPIPYLNWKQGPYKHVPGAEFTFRVTGDEGLPSVLIEDFSDTDAPLPASQQGPGELSLSVDRGAVGELTTLSGSNLPANTTLSLQWTTMVGNRVSRSGFTEEVSELGSVQTDADGQFVEEMAIPDDLGGQHRIEVAADGEVLGATGLVIQPSVATIEPTRVRAGDDVTIHLKGVGWTTYDNTYAVTYDNSYIGYVCGFSTNGDVQFTVTATGAPGTHIIDLYPTIYKGESNRPRVYSVPQLTYVDDHPQRTTPAIRLAIEVVE